MATASENTVLVEIVTAANLAGIEQAKTSLLGFSALTLGSAAALGIAYQYGKAAVQNYEAQASAQANLNNAIKDRNALDAQGASDPKAIANVQKAQENLTKAQQALGLEEDRLAQKRKLAKPDLDELRIKNEAVTKAENELTAANAAVSASQQAQRYDNTVLQQQVRDFIQTNRGFIDNQYDAVQGFASFVREGVPAKDLVKAMTAAMDIAAAEGISLTDAVTLLQSAESGRAAGLRKLVGIQLENVSATATEADKTKTAAANLDLVSKAYAGAHNNLSPFQQDVNKLNQDAQTFTEKGGPGIVEQLDNIVQAATIGVGILGEFADLLGVITGDPSKIAALVGGPAFLQAQMNLLAGGPTGQMSTAAHARPGNFAQSTPGPGGGGVGGVTVNVNAPQVDPRETGRALAQIVRRAMQT